MEPIATSFKRHFLRCFFALLVPAAVYFAWLGWLVTPAVIEVSLGGRVEDFSFFERAVTVVILGLAFAAACVSPFACLLALVLAALR